MDRLSRRRFVYSASLAFLSSGAASAFAKDDVRDDKKDKDRKDKPEKGSKRFRPKRAGDGHEAPVGEPAITAAPTPGTGVGLGTGASALILYDTTGEFGWLGELYGTMAANLVSHFGPWKAQPVSQYTAGQMNAFSAVIYIGSTFDEPLPVAFLDDVLAGRRPVIWCYDNIWQLTARMSALSGGDTATFFNAFGWMWWSFDTSTVPAVFYEGTQLNRYGPNMAGIMNYERFNPAVVLAYARRADGTSFPWAVRSRNLTYIGENPFVFITEGDRLLAFEDMLFDILAPTRPERHRALLRLEDIAPVDNPALLRSVADYLWSRNVPFGFGVISRHKDPFGRMSSGRPQDVRLRDAPALVSALRYLQQRGGVMIEHGWTHQYSNVLNPYNAVSGDDFEFYRVTENPDHTLTHVGPLPEDSPAWMNSRIDGAAQEFQAAGLATPAIFEFPHYAASATDYRTVATRFATRWERALYFKGVLSGGTVDHSRLAGQRFSFPVRDVYGTKVLPENLGSIEPEQFFIFPTRFPADILADARRVRVVRDGFASFYFHPFLDIKYLKETVEGLQAAGWGFVNPATL
jgi:uncharacterized protein YdaL